MSWPELFQALNGIFQHVNLGQIICFNTEDQRLNNVCNTQVPRCPTTASQSETVPECSHAILYTRAALPLLPRSWQTSPKQMHLARICRTERAIESFSGFQGQVMFIDLFWSLVGRSLQLVYRIVIHVTDSQCSKAYPQVFPLLVLLLSRLLTGQLKDHRCWSSRRGAKPWYKCWFWTGLVDHPTIFCFESLYLCENRAMMIAFVLKCCDFLQKIYRRGIWQCSALSSYSVPL